VRFDTGCDRWIWPNCAGGTARRQRTARFPPAPTDVSWLDSVIAGLRGCRRAAHREVGLPVGAAPVAEVELRCEGAVEGRGHGLGQALGPRVASGVGWSNAAHDTAIPWRPGAEPGRVCRVGVDLEDQCVVPARMNGCLDRVDIPAQVATRHSCGRIGSCCVQSTAVAEPRGRVSPLPLPAPVSIVGRPALNSPDVDVTGVNAPSSP